MNSNSQRPGAGGPKTNAPETTGRSPTFALVMLGVVAVGVIIAYQHFTKPPPPAAPSTAAPASGEDAASVKPLPAPAAQEPEVASMPEPPAVQVPAKHPARPPRSSTSPPPAPAPPLGPESAPSQQLIAGLTQLKLSDTGLTAEQAQMVSDSLKQIVAQGGAAVPAIREFLERNQDLSFGTPAGRPGAGPSSLRLGLIDALAQIGSDEALGLSRQVLQTTADPLEIARLTRNLEQQAPGQFREEALAAAREALAQAAQGQLGNRDVAPLFQVLQAYGDASVVSDLVTSTPRWNYYATMTLANLPEGQGVPTLIQLAQNTGEITSTKANFPLQMLAQVAPQFPEAQAALLEQARANRIPDSAWTGIAIALAGDQFQLGYQYLDSNFAVPQGPGLKTYHIVAGNQNYFSTAGPMTFTKGGPAGWSDEQIAARQTLIDQLLAVNSNPTAVQALQRARNSLPQPKP
ncbi:MAG: hypothetical protein HYY24_03915 [Verrucomicrobia bacterium]|nr:hypothetical protein [Verrucomicrobiota bacterium]